jgi:N-acetylglucosaminyl-diphospho-decaprenol L-rhamnosyltransferase
MRNGSAIVITYNSARAISACIESLLSQPGWEVIVVDNASSDDTAHLVSQYSKVRLVRNTVNGGFAAAANQGEKVAFSNVIVLLNPDTVAHPGALEKLAAALDDTKAAAAGGALIDENGRPQRGFQFRRFPTLAAMLAEVLLLNRAWPGNPWNRRYRFLDADGSQAQFVDQPAGACLAVRREAWESIGGFDESFYPVWFEDVDFCRRLADRGWKTAYCPEARFTHTGGHSVSKLAFREKQAFWYANMLRYFSKHHGRWQTNILRAGILAGLAIRSVASLIGVGLGGLSRKEALAGYAHAAGVVLQRSSSPAASKSAQVGIAAV